MGWDAYAPWEAQRGAFMQTWSAEPQRLRIALEQLAAAPGTAADPWLAEAVEVARESLSIKAVWAEQGEDAAHPMREEVIKRLVSRHVEASDATVLMNVGSYHVQRRHAMGTPKVWLAEHLADPQGPIGGSVYAVYVNVASAQQLVSNETRELSIDEDPTELIGDSWGEK
ncbi:MAG: hypothetical protein ACE37F_18865 [Nannocystaceae bacterium]|nr:hypothetical protein [bacterium]